MQKEVPSFRCCGTTIPYKYASLVVLVVQNSFLYLMLRASRTAGSGEKLYNPSTAVILSEGMKFSASLCLVVFQEGGISGAIRQLKKDVWDKPSVTLKLLVPSSLYTLQGNLMFMAMTYLDAATFQVTYQAKIITTALFSVLLLGRRLSAAQWGSLFILMAGVAFIQMPESKGGDDVDASMGGRLLGLAMVITACFSSGFAGIYFEKMLKGETAGVWVLNVQLGFLGMIVGTIGLLYRSYDDVMENGFFFGYTKEAYMAISLQAFGGLIVAVVVKYADNILKGFATSLSIVLSSVVSYFFLNFILTPNFVIGATMVCGSTYIYGAYPVPKAARIAAAAAVVEATSVKVTDVSPGKGGVTKLED